MRHVSLWSALLTLCLLAGTASAVELKVASLAPKGSRWAQIMEKAGGMVDTQTGGRVTMRFFFSGTQGDEREAVRKMKLGQLDGAAVTAVGLGLIKSDVRVLELPFLLQTDAQLDHVRGQLQPEFEKQFDEAGYVLLAWGDVGWVHLFTNTAITSKEALSTVKMWAWTDDSIVREYFAKLDVNGVPLGVPDVLPALSTGSIDGCYGSPLAAVALQWYTKVKFATSKPISYSIGALVVKKEVFSLLSAEDQATLRSIGKSMTAEFIGAVRTDNARARKAMEKSGIQFVDVPPAMVEEMRTKALGVWDVLAEKKLYSPELLAKVKATLASAPQ